MNKSAFLITAILIVMIRILKYHSDKKPSIKSNLATHITAIAYVLSLALISPIFTIFYLTIPGIIMNMAVMLSNNGYMPVKYNLNKIEGAHTPITPTTKLVFFCDRFKLLWGVISFGDMFITLGSITGLIVLTYLSVWGDL